MTWQLFDANILGEPYQILLDDQFVGNMPCDELPTLSWFGIWCRQDTDGHFWNQLETEKLSGIENDLLRLASEFSNGWAVYVRRAISTGKFEYCFYHGEGAALQDALQPLKTLHPEYRIEYDSQPDPEWSLYTAWLEGAPNS